MTETLPPKTAAEALKLWDDGADVPAFRVESQDATQQQIYAAAFEMIRASVAPTDASPNLIHTTARKLTQREVHVAKSIAQIALKFGWRAMLQQHIGEQIPAITVQKASTSTAP